MANYLPGRQAAEKLGLHQNTLRKYADQGIIQTVRTPSGQRRYDVESFLGDAGEQKVVCYCRVASPGQKDELMRQVSFMAEHFPTAEMVKDVGSALNYKRKGLKSILGRCVRGEKIKIVVTHRDRLARFGFELIELIVNECGGSVMVLNDSVREPAQELTADLLTIIHTFSCRLYGLRNYNNKQAKNATKQVAKAGAEFVVRSLQIHLQRDDLVIESENGPPELHGDKEIPDSVLRE